MKAILLATFKEAVRKKTFLVIGIITALYLVFWSILLHFFQSVTSELDFSLGSYLITQMGLQFSSMLIALLTIMLGAGAVATDLDTGLIHAIISRPLRRRDYIFGKLLGLAAIVAIYATALFSLLLGIGALFGLPTITSLTLIPLLRGWLLFIFVPVAVLCLTLFGSVRFRTVPNGILMIFIYILGNIGGMVEMVGKYINNNSVSSTGIFISLLSPFHTIFSETQRTLMSGSDMITDLLRSAGGLSGSGAAASIWMYFYTVAYAVFFIWMAVRLFSRKDIV